jgi:DNA repair exonuclease SbcCD ATPase subunit
MIAKKLILHNYYSHTDTELTFDKEIYSIIGKIEGTNKSNGSGKSSIVRGINFALWGDATESEKSGRNLQVKGDALIYNDADEMAVTFGFEMNENEYEIKRTLKRGSTALVYISKNGEKPLKYGVKDGQEVIERILRTNYEIFKNTSYFQQGDLNSFSKLTPKTAKDVVMSILQLDIYSNYEQTVKDQISTVKDKIQGLESRQTTLEEMIKKQKETRQESKYSQKDLKQVEEELNEAKFHKQLEAFWENSKTKSLELIDKHRTELQQNLSKVEAEINLVDQRVRKLEKLSGIKKCPTCEQDLKEEDIASIIKMLKTDLEKRIPSKTQLRESLSNIDKTRTEIRSYSLSLYDESLVMEKNRKLSEIKTELKRATQDKSKLADLIKENSKVIEDVKKDKELLSRYKKLQEAFGRNGIPAHIIENVIPEIEETANDILTGLDTNIRISIESQKDLKSGGKAETLDINVITQYGERPYANYSGGEKTFIDFAIRMALSIILSRRSNCQIQTLILDEIWENLDAVNRSLVTRAISWIKNKFDFKRILIISHQEELRDAFENVIKVYFGGKRSYVK